MHLHDYIPEHELGLACESGLVNVRHHEVLPLSIYNYTKKAQYSGEWTTATMRSRGLVVDSLTGEVVARGFQKFFNLAELPQGALPAGGFSVFDKPDGALGILVQGYGDSFITTRGSFASKEAYYASRMWSERYSGVRFPEGVTALFEIICPETRIVVDYGGMEDLVLLAVIDLETGLDRADLMHLFPGPKVESFDVPANIGPAELMSRLTRENREGLVVRFDDNHFRVKIKQDDYVALHRARFGASLNQLYSHYLVGTADEFVASIPEEFSQEYKEELRSLRKAALGLHLAAVEAFWSLGDSHDRKELAAKIKKNFPGPLSSALFAMYDGKDVTALFRKFAVKEIKNG